MSYLKDYPNLSYKISTAPQSEPITLSEAKTQIRFDDSDLDETINSDWIPAARQAAEDYCQRAFITQTAKMFFNHWPDGGIIKLPYGPAQSITSFTYTDSDGNQQDVTDYRSGLNNKIPWLKPLDSWPITNNDYPESIEITWVTGYGDNKEDVPSTIRQAIKIILADIYQGAQSFVKNNVNILGYDEKPLWQKLLDPYVIYY